MRETYNTLLKLGRYYSSTVKSLNSDHYKQISLQPYRILYFNIITLANEVD